MFVFFLLVSMPVALDGLHRFLEELATLHLPPRTAWVVLEGLSLIHQGVRNATSTAFGGQEQIYITRRRSKPVALIGQQSFDESEFSIRNRHGAANAFSPQPFMVAPCLGGKDRSLQKEHVDSLVDEGASKPIGPTVGSSLEPGHPV